MASVARSSLLRQAQSLSSRRVFAAPKSVQQSSAILPRIQYTQRSLAPYRLAPFSTTTSNKILPPGPQVISGGVNDPAPVPKPSAVHGSYHWTAERLVSVGIIPLTLAPFIGGSAMNATIDALFVGTILIHSHIGFQSIIIDYIPNYEYPTARKLFAWLLNAATLLVGIGWYEFETNDVGLCEAVKRVWRAGSANDATIGAASPEGLGFDGKLKHLKN